MVGRLFGLSWWRWDSGRVIIALQAAVRNRGRWLVVIPVLSLLQAAKCRLWQGVWSDSVWPAFYSQGFLGPDNIFGQGREPSEYRIWECRVLPWGDRDRELTCHVSHGGMLYGVATWAFGGDPKFLSPVTWEEEDWGAHLFMMDIKMRWEITQKWPEEQVARNYSPIKFRNGATLSELVATCLL